MMRFKPKAICAFLTYIMSTSAFAANGIDVFNIIDKPKRYEFEHVVLFGDSLTDAGSAPDHRFVAGGYDYPGYFDALSKYFTGKRAFSNFFGGTDYAIASSNVAAVRDQIRHYIEDNHGKLSKKFLNVLWIGAVDVNLSIIYNFYKLPFYDFKARHFTLYNHLAEEDPAVMLGQSIKNMLDAKAPYVIVPNAPNAAFAPITSLFHVDAITSLAAEIIPKPFDRDFTLAFRKIYGNYLDQRLRHLPQNGQGQAFHKARTLDAFAMQFPFIPRPLLDTILDKFIEVQTDVARQYNTSVHDVLYPMRHQVLVPDVDSLFTELIDNSVDWHVGSTNLTACSLSYPASECTPERGNFFQDRHYIFGDWFHPSWETHVGIAQYIISILNAPDQYATLLNQLDGLNEQSNSLIDGYIAGIKTLPTQPDTWQVFGGYSAFYQMPYSYVGAAKNHFSHTLNMGVATAFNRDWQVGTLLSISLGRVHPFTHFSYRQNSENLSIFAAWLPSEKPYWAEGSVAYGDLQAHHIERGVKLGDTYRIEPADAAHAKRFSALIKGGLAVYRQDSIATGPFIGLGFNHEHLSAVRDKLNHPTSLRLDASKHNKTYALIGWQINMPKVTLMDKKANASAEINYQQAFHVNPYCIQTGVKYLPFDIPKEVSLPKEKRWLSLKGHGQVEINPTLSATASFGFLIDKNKNKSAQISIGLKKTL